MKINEQHDFLLDVCKLIEHATSLGFIVTGGDLYRPQVLQEIYFKEGKTKTLKSKHIERLALDLNFFNADGKLISDKKQLQAIGDFWENLDPQNRWGGNWLTFIDTPHFQRGI